MKLSITSRLTFATAVLTALLFVPAGIAVYSSVASGIRAESIRNVEALGRNLVFSAFYQWDEDLLDEYEEGDPLGTLSLDTPHWALWRGDGRLVQNHGIFDGNFDPGCLSEPGGCVPTRSVVVDHGGVPLRIASVPLLEPRRESLDSLPEPVRRTALRASPAGTFLRAESESSGGHPTFQIFMLEEERIKRFEVTPAGEFVKGVKIKYEDEVPANLVALINAETPLEEIAFESWRAYNSHIVAIVRGRDASGETVRLAVNRLGERFELDENLQISGPDPGSRLWVTTAGDATSEVFARRRLLTSLALGLPLLWGAVVLVGWYITRRAMSPVQRIVDSVERIEISRLGERLPVGDSADELDRISATINGMLDRIEAGYERECEFSGDAAHELRGPLARVIAEIDVTLSKSREPAEYRDALTRLRSHAQGMQGLVESLLWLVRLESSRRSTEQGPFELTDLAAETVLCLPETQASRVKLSLADDATPLMTRGNRELVRVMLQNLLQNALRYSPPGTPVELRIGRNGRTVQVDIEDRGEGVPEAEFDRVFSRFYRVDKSRSRETGGFGLGLAIVREIASVQGTRVTLENLTGGFVASFSLPLSVADSDAGVPAGEEDTRD